MMSMLFTLHSGTICVSNDRLVIEAIPKCCVAAGCDGGSEEGLSLQKFFKNPEAKSRWSREVAKRQSDWTGPSNHSVLCSQHFTQDNYEASVVLTKELGLPCKKRRLKDIATSTLFIHIHSHFNIKELDQCSGHMNHCTATHWRPLLALALQRPDQQFSRGRELRYATST